MPADSPAAHHPEEIITAAWRRRTAPLRLLYALYAWPMFLLMGFMALIPLLLLPRLAQRRRLVQWVARLALATCGVRMEQHGLTQLPLPCVVVANHASYLDGVVLAAVLPPQFGFVIKREMRAVPAAGWLLMRIGAYFVARQRNGSARDALRLMRGARSGEALAFFPEGTFRREPGLLRFHTGAFVAALQARLPIAPLVIRGTRRCLAPGSVLPWPGRIVVECLPALPPPNDHNEAAAAREAVRALYLSRLPLPDLADRT